MDRGSHYMFGKNGSSDRVNTIGNRSNRTRDRTCSGKLASTKIFAKIFAWRMVHTTRFQGWADTAKQPSKSTLSGNAALFMGCSSYC